jgi:Calcineurin-like phosphoesterase.
MKKLLLFVIALAITVTSVISYVPVALGDGEGEPVKTTLLDWGSSDWKYIQYDATAPTGSFPGTGLDDTSWTAAKLPIGYANAGKLFLDHIQNGGSGSLTAKDVTIDYTHTAGTTITSNKYGTIVQKKITINNLDDIEAVYVSSIADDGTALLINNVEASLFNSTSGNGTSDITTYGYRRNKVIGDMDGTSGSEHGYMIYKDVLINKSLFKEGENVLTLLILNDTRSSSDLYADLKIDVTSYYETVLDWGSDGWKYTQYDAIAPEGPFPAAGLDDTSWTAADMPIGYANAGRQFLTSIQSGWTGNLSNKGITINYTHTAGTVITNGKYGTVAQKKINIDSLDGIRQFLISGVVDDGAAVLVNNKEAALLNVSTGNGTSDITVYGYRRSQVIDNMDDNTHGDMINKDIEVPASLFKVGENIITVIVVNDTRGSSDLYADVKIVSDRTAEPETDPPITVLDWGSSDWKYIQYDANAPDGPFPAAGLEDSTWTAGKLPIGYATAGRHFQTHIDNGHTGMVIGTDGNQSFSMDYTHTAGTTIAKDKNGTIAQKSIEIASLDGINGFLLSSISDDGLAVLINNKQAAIFNANANQGTGSTCVYGYKSIGPVNNFLENTDPRKMVNLNTYIPASLFREGANTITLVLLNDTVTSSDLYADIKLASTTKAPEYTAENITFHIGEKEDERNFAWIETVMPLDEPEVGPNDYSFNCLGGAVEIEHLVKNSNSAIASGDGRFVDNNAYVIYKLPVQAFAGVGTVVLDIVNNYTINLATDYDVETESATWGETIADPSLVGVADPGGKRLYIYIDLADYATVEFLYIRIGDQTPDSGWGGKIKSIRVTDQIVDGSENTTDDAVVWVTSDDGFDEEFIGTRAVNETMANCRVTISGLEQGKTYKYKVGDKTTGQWSKEYTFKTQTITADGEYQAIFVGDPQIGGGNGASNDGVAFANNMKKALEMTPDAAFIVAAGDQVDNCREEEWDHLQNNDVISSIPFMQNFGNHDKDSRVRPHYNQPNPSDLGDMGGGGGYFYAYGNTLYIIINGNSHDMSAHRANIDRAIKAHPEAKWRVVVTHQDVYGAGQHAAKTDLTGDTSPHDMRINLTPYYEKMGIDFVLNGHDHTYARSYIMKNQIPNTSFDLDLPIINPPGVQYITANTSGLKFYGLVGNPSWVARSNADKDPQFSVINATGDSFTVTTYRNPIGGTPNVLDEVTITKDKTLVLPGDATLNNKVEMDDVMLTLNTAAGKFTGLSYLQKSAAKHGTEGDVNAADALWILKKVIL